MLETLQHLLATYGYLAIALGVLLASMGIPLPGETFVLLGAAYAGTGRLSVWGVIVAAAVGAILGDTIAYGLGKRYGRDLLDRFVKSLHLSREHLARAERFFTRYGDKTVFFGHFLTILRAFSAFLAGVYRMPFGRFLLYNIAGGILSSAIYGLLGAAFGSQWQRIEHWMGRAGLLIAAIVVMIGLVILLWRRANRHEVALRAGWRSFVNQPRIVAIRDWVAARLATIQARRPRSEYLGLHLAVGAALIIGGSWLFGAIAEGVLHHERIVAIDAAVSQFLAAHHEPPFTAAMYVVSLFGSPVTVLLLTFLLALYFAGRRAWRVVALFVLGVGGAELLDVVLKVLIARPRPTAPDPLLKAIGYSFPSGHAMGSMAFYGLLAYLVIRQSDSWRWRVTVALTTIVLMLLIGFSRIYLGVHYLSDVLAGYIAGCVWLAITITGVNIVTGRRYGAAAKVPPGRPSVSRNLSR